jgi:hypothetical protein
MVDNITSIIPGCTNTKNKIKLYEIVLNPDLLPSIDANQSNSSLESPQIPSTQTPSTQTPSTQTPSTQTPSTNNIENPSPNNIERPSNSTIIDIALNDPRLALVPGVQEKRDEVNNGISTLTNFVNMLQNVKNEALDFINPVIKEASALPGGIQRTVSNPNNIFFLREPKNFATNTANIISSSVNQVVKSIRAPIIPKLPPPRKIKLPTFRF